MILNNKEIDLKISKVSVLEKIEKGRIEVEEGLQDLKINKRTNVVENLKDTVAVFQRFFMTVLGQELFNEVFKNDSDDIVILSKAFVDLSNASREQLQDITLQANSIENAQAEIIANLRNPQQPNVVPNYNYNNSSLINPIGFGM